MAELREEPSETFILRAYCACGTELERYGCEITLSDPPGVPYRCPCCGTRETLYEFYPKGVSRPAGGVGGGTTRDELKRWWSDFKAGREGARFLVAFVVFMVWLAGFSPIGIF